MSYNNRSQGSSRGGPPRGGQGAHGGGTSRAGGQGGNAGGDDRRPQRPDNRPPQGGNQPPRSDNRPGGGGGGGRPFPDRTRGGGGGGRGGRAPREPPTRLHANLSENMDMRKYEDGCIKVQDHCAKDRIAEWHEEVKKQKTKPPKEQKIPPGPPPPRRPAYATIGRPFLVRSDFFEISFRDLNKCFYSYSVKLTPDPTAKWLKKAVFLALLEDPLIKKHAGSSDMAQELVTVGKLEKTTFQITLPGRTERTEKGQAGKKTDTFSVNLHETIKVCPEEILNALKDNCQKWPLRNETIFTRILNIVMTRHQTLDEDIVTTGQGRQKYFYIDPRRKEFSDLYHGLEVLRGYFSSVRFGANKLLLNLNVTHGTFFAQQPVSAYTKIFMDLHGYDWAGFNSQIKAVRVEVNHLPKEVDRHGREVYQQRAIWGVASPEDGDPSSGRPRPRVKLLGSGPDDVSFFEDVPGNPGGGAWTTVTSYFQRRYNVRAGAFPVLNLGNKQRPVYVPQECCRILPGQVFRGELVTVQRQNMITFSCRRPPDNFKSITEDGLSIMGIANDKVRETNLDIKKEMITVPARLLAPPLLKYGDTKTNVRAASWNLARVKFTALPRDKVVWTLVVFRRSKGEDREDMKKPEEDLSKPTSDFMKSLRGLGIQLNNPTTTDGIWKPFNDKNYRSQVEEVLNREICRRSTFVLVLIPENEEKLFNHIKWIGDCKVGCLTHCCKYVKWKDGNDQYMANNAMKVNLKLGGTCQSLDSASSTKILAGNKTMVVGLDVTHPAAGDYLNFPSIAAMVASVNSKLGQWPGEARIQAKNKDETIKHTGVMLEWRLKAWHAKNNSQLPENILIYRDGVSEGQYLAVLHEELEDMKETCRGLYNRKKLPQPRFTYIVVTKRHHVRFFGAKAEEIDQNGNLHPGTVIDRGVTRPSLWDFYLQAQQAIMGSARPAHYVVMHDEIFTDRKANPDGNPADKVQELSHNICYMMGRCTRAVSYGTPAFLADMFCERARRYAKAYFTEAQEKKGGPKNYGLAGPQAADLALHTKYHETMVYI